MKRSRLTDSQIMEALKRVEAGLAVLELCRELGQYGDLLQVALKVRRHGRFNGGTHEGAGGGERPAAQDVRGREAQGRDRAGGA